jgi:hypothetical protein
MYRFSRFKILHFLSRKTEIHGLLGSLKYVIINELDWCLSCVLWHQSYHSFKRYSRLPITRVKTWYLHSVGGVFMQLNFENKANYMQGWGQSQALASWGTRVYKSVLLAWWENMGLISISVNGANHTNLPCINVHPLVFWYLNAQNYISRERLVSA